MGLHLNRSKTELICTESAGKQILAAAPDLCRVSPSEATLLGSPIGQDVSINAAITDKVSSLKVMGSRLCLLTKHDAILLLRHCIATPRVLYTLRTAPCFRSPCLEDFDLELRSILSTVLNINLDNDSVWSQATLPVRNGGIRVRRATQLAPSTFLPSVAGCSSLINQIVPQRLRNTPDLAIAEAVHVWSRGHNQPPPPTPENTKQRMWDGPCVQANFEALLSTATEPRSRARLLAAATSESGSWLNAVPASSLGLRMDDDVVRIAVGLHLGAPLCRPHACQLCSAPVDEQAIHGLSCIRSAGRQSRHVAINDVVKRALSSAQIPSMLEPTGLSRSDGKRPDGVTIAPWKSGCMLVWDVSCTDTFALSHLAQGVTEAQAVAGQDKMRKRSKYEIIARTHHFVPMVVETSGAFGTEALDLFAEIARRVHAVTQEVRAQAFLLQQVSVALQRGNAASVLGSMGSA